MKSRFLAWLLMIGVAATLSYGMPRSHAAKYHCMCYEICKKVAAKDRCGLDQCNGMDPNYQAEARP